MLDALLVILATTFNAGNYQLTVTGTGFADNQYPVSSVAISVNGTSWTAADTIKTWGDNTVLVSFASKPAPGSYYVKLTSSDNVTDTLAGAFYVAGISRRSFGFGFGLGF